MAELITRVVHNTDESRTLLMFSKHIILCRNKEQSMRLKANLVQNTIL